MTVEDTSNKIQYTGDGVTTGPFPFTFQTEEEWIEVFVASILVSNTTYTLTVNPNQDTSPGGQVDFDVAPADQDSIVILRTAPLTQESDYIAFDAFPSERVEDDFDKAVIIDQQLQEQLTRTLTLPVDATQNTVLPPATSLGYWRWNASATEVEYAGAPGVVIPSEAVATVTDMLTNSNPVSGEIVFPAGYNASGDGGGSQFLTRPQTGGPYDPGSLIRSIGDPDFEFLNLFPGGLRNVNQWGAVGDGALSGLSEEGSGTGTDNSAAIQAALNFLRDNGGTLNFVQGKVYLCNSGLTLLRNTVPGPSNYNIQFNNSALDFSNMTNDIAFDTGADSLANIATDTGQIVLANGKLIGAQTGNPGGGTPPPNTDTTGVKLGFAYNVKLDHMVINRFYIGLYTNFAFGCIGIGCQLKRNWIGYWMDEVSNANQWVKLEAPQCAFGLLIKPTTTLDSGKTVNTLFTNPRFEGSQVGVQMDPGNLNAGISTLRDIIFINPYFAGELLFDAFRLGVTVDTTDPSVRGANAVDRITGLQVIGGNYGASSPTRAQFFFDTARNVREATINVGIDGDDANAFVNVPRLSQVTFTSRQGSTADMYRVTQYGPQGQKWTQPQEALITWTTGDQTPDVAFSKNFMTNNGGPTTITTFDNPGLFQEIFVIIGDANTTVDFTGTNLIGNGGVDWSPGLNDTMTCTYDGTNWYCRIDNTG